MDSAFNICQLIENGGVFDNIEGSTPEEIYDAVSKIVPLPIGLERTVLSARKSLARLLATGLQFPTPGSRL